jgi:hypothetical protein
MRYLANYGANAWQRIVSDRDSQMPVAPGTESEAIRNAEHYLYAFQLVSQEGVPVSMMDAGVVGYHATKFWTNVAEYYFEGFGFKSPWTYSIPTTGELAAGFAGAHDAMYFRRGPM